MRQLEIYGAEVTLFMDPAEFVWTRDWLEIRERSIDNIGTAEGWRLKIQLPRQQHENWNSWI